jgi:ubiquinone/menaquinone biosynthesis C-methylase UbiE
MQTETPNIDTVKQRMKTMWSAGDFGEVAKFTAAEAEAFVNRLSIDPKTELLDVACGSGNIAIPAARKGAIVTGVDIAPNLVEQARARAKSENIKAEFREGDAEQLPFPDAQFDVVTSMFGAMFAPRPDLVASELARVCRPGGLIAMANWTPEGFVGKSFAVTNRYVPPPEGIPAPVLWGKEDVVRERFSKLGRKVETFRRILLFKYPFDAKAVVEFFRRYFGPTQMAFSRLDTAGQAALSQEMERLWTEHNQGSASQILVPAEYLEVRAS